jgi:hypothetical protein
MKLKKERDAPDGSEKDHSAVESVESAVIRSMLVEVQVEALR